MAPHTPCDQRTDAGSRTSVEADETNSTDTSNEDPKSPTSADASKCAERTAGPEEVRRQATEKGCSSLRSAEETTAAGKEAVAEAEATDRRPLNLGIAIDAEPAVATAVTTAPSLPQAEAEGPRKMRLRTRHLRARQ